ncbi:MAG: hypothetical protein HYW62_02495 [Candidatus Levybacteria bacterium]|nr:hypothetical protein [Candidatus Levybacteria bacterium]
MDVNKRESEQPKQAPTEASRGFLTRFFASDLAIATVGSGTLLLLTGINFARGDIATAQVGSFGLGLMAVAKILSERRKQD